MLTLLTFFWIVIKKYTNPWTKDKANSNINQRKVCDLVSKKSLICSAYLDF